MKNLLLRPINKRNFVTVTLLFTLFLCIAWIPCFGQTPVKLKFASHSVGSSWYLLGAAVTELIKKNLPSGSNIDLLPFAAGIGNPKLVSKGDADLGFGTNVTNFWAYQGKAAYDTRMENLRSLLGGLDIGWLAVMVRSKVDVNSFEEIIEKKFPIKLMVLPSGSLGEFGARQIMEAYGISVSDIKSWGGSVTNTSFGAIVSAMRDGRIDGFIHVITPGHPTATELALTTGIKFLPLKEEVIKRLEAEGWDPTYIPPNSFKGQDKEIKTVGFYSGIITTKDFPENLAYLVTKVVNQNKSSLVDAYNAVKIFDPKTAWLDRYNRIPLHTSAERYYKENKWKP